MDCYSDKYEGGLFGTVGFVPSRQKTKKEKGKNRSKQFSVLIRRSAYHQIQHCGGDMDLLQLEAKNAENNGF